MSQEFLIYRNYLLLPEFTGDFDPKASFNLCRGPNNRIGRLASNFSRHIENYANHIICCPRRIVGVSGFSYPLAAESEVVLSPIELFDVHRILGDTYHLQLSKIQHNLFYLGKDQLVSLTWMKNNSWEVGLINHPSQISTEGDHLCCGSQIFHCLFRTH